MWKWLGWLTGNDDERKREHLQFGFGLKEEEKQQQLPTAPFPHIAVHLMSSQFPLLLLLGFYGVVHVQCCWSHFYTG
jgi:hypothetical protein